MLDLNYPVTRLKLGDGSPVKTSMAGGIGPSTHAPGSPDEDNMLPGRSQQTVLGLNPVHRRRTGRGRTEHTMNTKSPADLRPHAIIGLDLADQPRPVDRPHPHAHWTGVCRSPTTAPRRRRRTGGEHPATRQHQPTRNDSRRQGQRPDRSIAAGYATAVLAFTQQWSVPRDGAGVERLPPTARPWGGGLPERRIPVGEPATVIPVVPAKVLGPQGQRAACGGLSRCAG